MTAPELKEHDMIELLEDLGLYWPLKGEQGTVVHIYKDGTLEVEFAGDVFDVSRDQVKKI